MHRPCKFIDKGLSEYSAVYKEQLDLVERRKCGKLDTDVVLLTEHQDVYTYGRKSKEEIPPKLSQVAFEIERGGEATFHNPGQLVCYPILLLRSDEQDVHLHLRRLEELAVEIIRNYGIIGERREGATGVWVKGKDKKIASIGIAVKSWVTYHGMALNVSNDLSGFGKINPCGFQASVMTSMAEELGVQKGLTMLEVKNTLLEKFPKVFSRSLE